MLAVVCESLQHCPEAAKGPLVGGVEEKVEAEKAEKTAR